MSHLRENWEKIILFEGKFKNLSFYAPLRKYLIICCKIWKKILENIWYCWEICWKISWTFWYFFFCHLTHHLKKFDHLLGHLIKNWAKLDNFCKIWWIIDDSFDNYLPNHWEIFWSFFGTFDGKLIKNCIICWASSWKIGENFDYLLRHLVKNSRKYFIICWDIWWKIREKIGSFVDFVILASVE